MTENTTSNITFFYLDSSTLPDFGCLSQQLPSSGPVPPLRVCLLGHLLHFHLMGTPTESRLSPCSCSNIACASCQKQTECNKTKE